MLGLALPSPSKPRAPFEHPIEYPLNTQIVWFKRDLRIADHAPLRAALVGGPTLALYVVEPDLWTQPDRSLRQWLYLRDCLIDLDEQLRGAGGSLTVRVGEVLDVLGQIQNQYGDVALWSHEETGTDWTYQRDIAVSRWAKANNVRWHEQPQFGVFRGLKDRDGWSRRWRSMMQESQLSLPDQRDWVSMESTPGWRELEPEGLSGRLGRNRQGAGRKRGLADLDSFLDRRGERYNLEMSSPITAETSCSRLSTHIAHGTLSMREIAQATWQRQAGIRALPKSTRGTWPKALSAYQGRLHWHCHFIQKLESEPRIEYENLARVYDGMREKSFREDFFDAWRQGQTGYPFVDACMRFLRVKGWINFRMRAMLTSFASYDLWLHWQRPAHFLAQCFTDYEPGIHYSQIQMQSGTTGMNTVRIYSPVKQSCDQDPDGDFIRRWVPELEGVNSDSIHEPWKMSAAEQQAAGVKVGTTYPRPLVDHQRTAKFARSEIYGRRRTAEARTEQAKVVKKHGSRRRPSRM